MRKGFGSGKFLPENWKEEKHRAAVVAFSTHECQRAGMDTEVGEATLTHLLEVST